MTLQARIPLCEMRLSSMAGMHMWQELCFVIWQEALLYWPPGLLP
jgi:hypothetical protein